MLAAHVLYPVQVLGPGRRVGIWVYGCHRRCRGCMSPELQLFPASAAIRPEALASYVRDLAGRNPVDGITISGGEPFEQDRELAEFLRLLGDVTRDVLVFSGYPIGELEGSPLLSQTAVLVDGEYREELNEGHPLKGSKNQTIHYLKPEFRAPYEAYIERMRGEKAVQTFQLRDGVFVVGIRERGFVDELERRAGLSERSSNE